MNSAWNNYLARRYTILFYSLVLTMVFGPMSESLGMQSRHVEQFLAFNLLAALLPVGRNVRWRALLLAVLAMALVTRFASQWLHEPVFAIYSLAGWALLALGAAASALLYALKARVIDSEHIYAALSAYLLTGLFIGTLYWAIEQAEPGSLIFTGDFTHLSAIYFSFITLATVGYGDILPRSDLARGLAMFEGVGGQLFLAVMIARLVSLYVARRASE